MTKPTDLNSKIALGREIIISVVACPYCAKIMEFPFSQYGKMRDGMETQCTCCLKMFKVEWQ